MRVYFIRLTLGNEQERAERYYLLLYLTFLSVIPLALILVVFTSLQVTVFEKSTKVG